MSELKENTLTAYLGHEFQLRLMWQLLVEPEFAEKKILELSVDYFDDPILKRLFVIMVEFYNEYGKVPNFQNLSIHQAINKYKTPNNVVECESLFGIIKKIQLWNERILNKEILHDGDIIQQATNDFIKQQEYRKLAEYILNKTKSGEIKNKYTLIHIEEKINNISAIGEEEDYGIEVGNNIEIALRKEFRQTIPTGISVIDALTGGGLGRGEIGMILTPSGVGKAQPLSSKILTPIGWKKMGEINVGDLVIGSDGKSQRVLGVFPQGNRKVYRIEFNDGTATMCDLEHLWSINSFKQRTKNISNINGIEKNTKKSNYEYEIMSTKEMLNSFLIPSKNGDILNYRIPTVLPIEFTKKELPINPYLLGFIIGNSELTETSLRFNTIDSILLNKIISIISNDFPELSIKKISETISYSITEVSDIENKIINKIKNLNLIDLLKNKYIPIEYITSSINDRIELLQGLMDSEGYTSKIGEVQFNTLSYDLALNVRELVLSLGGVCKITKDVIKFKSSKGVNNKKYYVLTISFKTDDIKVFSLDRKQKRVKFRNKCKYISNITYSHDEDVQCIYVENQDHLYVTDDYILTHNTTLLTKIANTAYEEAKKVLQIIFEDTVEQVQRKHFTIWSNIPLTEIDDNGEYISEISRKKDKELRSEGGRLVIKRFSQEDTTMKDIRNWVLRYQKKWGYKFDLIVLDYLDCVESHKFTKDRNEAELVVIKSFEAMAGDFNIPCWSAIQSNRSGFDAEFVEAHQSGGSIKRIQKAHFFMSIAKTPEQKEAKLANIRIIKARFAADGQTFKDCIFNNDTMKIIIEDSRYANAKAYKKMKKYDDDDINKLEKVRNEIIEKSSDLLIHKNISEYTEKKIIEKISDDNIDDGLSDRVKNAFSNVLNENKMFDVKTNIPNNDSRIKVESEIAKIGNEDIKKQMEIQIPDIVDENFENIIDLFDNPDDIDNQSNDILKIIEEKRKTQNVIGLRTG